jgi:hypothetical protein
MKATAKASFLRGKRLRRERVHAAQVKRKAARAVQKLARPDSEAPQ